MPRRCPRVAPDVSVAATSVRGRHSYEFDQENDGAVFGVLNLDVDIDFSVVGMDPDPDVHWTDARVRGIIGIMQSVAQHIGRELSDAPEIVPALSIFRWADETREQQARLK
jgi:hypothetical protein